MKYICPSCNKEYPLTSEYFSKKPSNKSGFKTKCKKCCYTYVKIKKYDFNDSINIYFETLNNNIELPNKFWEKVEPEIYKDVVIYIFKYIENIQDNILNINTNVLKKYKLYSVARKLGGTYELINYVYPNKYYPWELKKSSQSLWKNDNNKLNALKWFVNKLYQDNIIIDIYDIPNILNYKLFVKYNLGGLVARYFNYSPYKAIDYLYPGKFKEWDFHCVPNDFYKNGDNIKNIMLWFINKLKEKEDINIDEIPKHVNIYTFEKYNLKSFLHNCFDGVSYKAFNFIYPNRWQPWEFKSCPNGYWNDKDNVINAIKWFIEKLINNNIINDEYGLNKIPVNLFLEEYNLSSLLNLCNHKKELLFEIYNPDLNKDFFNINYSTDNIRLKSKEELFIHEYFINKHDNVLYCNNSNQNKWYNSKYNESYIPDWIINNNIIIEYFGFLNNNSSVDYFVKYKEKTKRKIEFFSNIPGFTFIDLYRKDLLNNLAGIKNKFLILSN